MGREQPSVAYLGPRTSYTSYLRLPVTADVVV